MIWAYNARIIAIFAVVLLHVAAQVLLNSPFASEKWVVANIIDASVRWCVPVFVMLSGALLLDASKKEFVTTFYKKRISRIAIPLAFWSLFFIAWTIFKGIISKDTPSIVDLLFLLLKGRPYYHMWFLFMIVGLYLFTPFLRALLDNITKYQLIFLVSLLFLIAALDQFFAVIFPTDFSLFINLSLLFMPYFIVGKLFRNTDIKLSSAWLIFIVIATVIVTAGGVYWFGKKISVDVGFYFYSYLSISVIPMSFAVFALLKQLDRPLFLRLDRTQKVADLTLGIYLIHPIFIDVFKYFGIFEADVHPFFLIIIFSILAFGISLLISLMMKQLPYIRKTI